MFGAIQSRCERHGCSEAVQEAQEASGDPHVQASQLRGRTGRVAESFPAETLVDGLPRARYGLKIHKRIQNKHGILGLKLNKEKIEHKQPTDSN